MTSFEEDMRDMRRQLRAEIIYTINSSPELYKIMRGLNAKTIKERVNDYAKKHNEEFGTVFIAELDALKTKDWTEIAKSI